MNMYIIKPNIEHDFNLHKTICITITSLKMLFNDLVLYKVVKCAKFKHVKMVKMIEKYHHLSEK